MGAQARPLRILDGDRDDVDRRHGRGGNGRSLGDRNHLAGGTAERDAAGAGGLNGEAVAHELRGEDRIGYVRQWQKGPRHGGQELNRGVGRRP